MLLLQLPLLLLLLLTNVVFAREPPRVSSRVERRQIARVGDTFRLPCPVEADPAPLLQWAKDGESIHAGWERFKMQALSLRIKNVLHEDAGMYTCKATNGFGSISVDFILYVLDVNETMTPPPDYDEDIVIDDGTAVGPEFVHTEQMDNPHIMQPAGSTVRLRCRATGKPRPSIVWLKDGQTMDFVDDGSSRWMLRLANTQEEDSGRYTCKVSNGAGTINFTYTLEIVEPLSKPVIMDPYPLNETVQYGNTAQFECHVGSDAPPEIQWLKKVDDIEQVRNKNSTITVENQQFVVLKMGKVLPGADGSYLNRLTIKDARYEDSGVYICLGANSMGYNIRSAYLTVVPPQEFDMGRPHGKYSPGSGGNSSNGFGDGGKSDGGKSSGMDPMLMGIIIGLSVLLFIIIIVVVTVTIYRHVQRRSKKVVRQPRPPNYTPDKHFYDHQYAALQQQQQVCAHPTPLGQPAPPPPLPRGVMPYQHVVGRDRYNMGSPHPDFHSDGSGSKSGTPVSLPPQQHTHIHYGGC